MTLMFFQVNTFGRCCYQYSSTLIHLFNLSLLQNCTVDLPGGPLQIEWREEDNHVYMTGSAELVYYGSLPL